MLLALVALLATSRALAQDDDPCEPDDALARQPVETTPSVGATGVTLDAPVAVRYSPGYFGADGPGDDPATLIQLVRCPIGTSCGLGCRGDAGVEVPGRVQVIGDYLFFLPDAGLEPESVYVGRARGVDNALDLRFCTGDAVDTGPPVLGDFIDATASDAAAECVLPDGGRLVGLRWQQAVDDGPAGSIEYFLYLVRATNVAAPQLRDRVRNYPSREITLNLRLSPEEIGAPVCVQAVAVDGVGNMSEPSPLQCFDPLTDAAFQPICAVSAPGSGRATGLGVASFALVLAGFVARRRRRAGRAACIR